MTTTLAPRPEITERKPRLASPQVESAPQPQAPAAYPWLSGPELLAKYAPRKESDALPIRREPLPGDETPKPLEPLARLAPNALLKAFDMATKRRNNPDDPENWYYHQRSLEAAAEEMKVRSHRAPSVARRIGSYIRMHLN